VTALPEVWDSLGKARRQTVTICAGGRWVTGTPTATAPQYIWGPLMVNAIRLVGCIAFMLMKDDQILVEKRSRTL
jgi:hypothetical protein